MTSNEPITVTGINTEILLTEEDVKSLITPGNFFFIKVMKLSKWGIH